VTDLHGRALAEWALPLARGAIERAAAGLDQPVRIAWYDALDADRCPAAHRERVVVDGSWSGWTPRRAARSLARDSLRAHMDAPLATGGVLPRPDPLEVVRARVADARRSPVRSLDDWLADEATTDDDRRLSAALATAWLSGLLRAAGWPLPSRTSFDDVRRWKLDHVTVAASVDAIHGKVTAVGDHEGWVLALSSGRGAAFLRDRACVEAAAMTLGSGIAPANVVVLRADAGDRLVVRVDQATLTRGIELIAACVREQRVAQQRGYDESDATPGPHCAVCVLLEQCAPGRTWSQGPGRGRAGLPVLAPD
jgi:hypothetical protein